MRLITRVDFDGLACATMLRELGVIDSWLFLHSDELEKGMFDVTGDDVLCNIPYREGCGLWFYHHHEEGEMDEAVYEGANFQADSTASVVYDYYEGRNRIPYMEDIVRAVDKVNSGKVSVDDIVTPTGWTLLGFIMDPHTGLGRFHDRIHQFAVDDVGLLEELMEECRDYGIDELLMMPNVAERVEVYWQQDDLCKKMLQKYSRLENDIVITDLRGMNHIRTGNRFMVYSLFPHTKISIWLEDSGDGQCLVEVGHSVIVHGSRIDIGHLMQGFGGSGHFHVGRCLVDQGKADEVLNGLIEKIKAEG